MDSPSWTHPHPSATHPPFLFSRRPSALWLELWFVLAECAVGSRAFAQWLPRSQPCCAAVGSWEQWGQGPVLVFEFFQVKLLLTQKSLSVSALPVLRNGYDSRQFERLFLKHCSISPVDCSWKSETLSISATLRENGVSPARQEDCLWLRAE